MEKKKETKKPIKKTTKKVVNKTTTKKTTTKKFGTKKKKKGFTLIELLAVIIILGILMIIAIPSVTRYISDSRKSAYVDTAKEVIGSARNLVNSGSLGMYSTNTTYYIPVECIKTENALKSPYGDFVEGGAFVGVIYDGKGYTYYWISVDDAGQGVKNITRVDKLDTDDIESDLKKSDITDVVETTGIGNRTEIDILKCSNNTWDPIILSNTNNNVSEEGGEKPNFTAAQEIGSLSELNDVAGAKRFIGANPSNYVKFNGNELWRIIGVYDDQLKIIRTTDLGYKQYHSTTPYPGWENSSVAQYLNNDQAGYLSTLSATAKELIGTGSWYVGACDYYEIIAATAYTCSKSRIVSNLKVGMLSVYEYLYAADRSCYYTTGFNHYSYSNGCGSKDWLNKGYMWLITQYSGNNTNAIYLDSYGSTRNNSVSAAYPIFPVVYLKSSVKITGGTGTSSDPYTLGL